MDCPFLRHLDVRKLPDIRSADPRHVMQCRELFADNRALALLAPFHHAHGIMEPGYGTGTDLRDQDRLAGSTVFIHPLEKLLGILRRFFLGIPSGIDIEGRNVHQIQADILEEAAGSEGNGTGGIQGAQLGDLRGIHAAAELRLALALIEQAPDIDGGMVHMLGDHFLIADRTLLREQRAVENRFRKRPCMVLFPHKNAQLITQIQESGIIGIMAGTDGVGAHVQNQLKVIQHGFHRQRAPELSVILVPVQALDPDLLSVQEDILAAELHGAESNPVHKIVHSLAVHRKARSERIQIALTDIPFHHISHRHAAFCAHGFPGLCPGKFQVHASTGNAYGCAGLFHGGHGFHPDAYAGIEGTVFILRGVEGHALNIGPADLLHFHRTIDSAVGHVIIGHMQRGGLTVAVVHLHAEIMLAAADIGQKNFKAGERVVMLPDFLSIPENLGGMTDAPEAEQYIPVPAHLYLAGIVRRPPETRKRRDPLPHARDAGHNGSLLFVMGCELPHAVQAHHRPDLMFWKNSLHSVSLLISVRSCRE